MGCASTRFTPMERHIQRHSVATGFEPYTPTHIVEVVKERSSAELVLSTQFEAIKIKLNLNSETSKPALEKFWSQRWLQGEEYRTRLLEANKRLEGIGTKVTVMEAEALIVAGILLCKASAKQKTETLFDLYDQACSSYLPVKSIRVMLKQLFTTAVDDLPLLLPEEQTSDDIPKYLKKCQEGVSEAIKAVGAMIMANGDRVNKPEFLDRLGRYDRGALLTPSGLREYALECGKLAQALAQQSARSKAENRS